MEEYWMVTTQKTEDGIKTVKNTVISHHPIELIYDVLILFAVQVTKDQYMAYRNKTSGKS